ncbi:MAG: O-antigen ligase family protein [Nitrospinae bacterium]|nr:O-antigen ligase family protein [Nitrospinota bacterium]
MDFLFEPTGYKSLGRNIGGFIDNANTFATYISIIFPLALSLFFINRNIVLRIFFGVSILIFALVLFYSQTRGAIAATLVSISIFLTVYCLFTKQIKLLLISALTIFAMILALLASPQTALYKRITFQGDTALSAKNERLIQWLVAIEMFKENPLLGVGPGGYQYKYKDYEIKIKEKPGSPFYGLSFYVAKHAHNEYLQLLAEIGLIGFLLFISLLFYYFYRVVLLIKALSGRKKRKTLFLINLGIACSLIAFLITAVTSLPFHITPCIIIPVALSGYQLMCVNRYV